MKVLDTLKEKHLLYRIATYQDAAAFAEIYDAYVDTMYRFVFFKVGSRPDAEDLTSEIFLKVWKYLQEESHSVQSIRALLYTVARNAVVDLYRSRAREKTESLAGVETLSITTDVRQELDAKDEVQKLIRDIRLLKQEYQEVLLLRFVEELSLREVARVIGKRPTNVRVMIHRALKKLEQMQTAPNQKLRKLKS